MDMNHPIYPAPPSYFVDLDNPQRTGQAANFWVGAMGMIIAAIFVGIRVYTKTILARNWTSDDGALIVAWVLSVAIQAIILFQYGRGTLGIHIWELTGYQVNSTLNLIAVVSILYCPFLACAKFSLLFFYLKLSHLRWFRICVYASMALVVGYNIALVFLLIFTCTPFERNWDVTITEGSCIDRTPLYMATAVLNMATDILLLILPIPMIANLQMPRAQKAGLICIFGIGSATCITSGIRLAVLFPMLGTIDQTWAVVMPGILILIEANFVIVTGCLPAMRLFFRHVAPHLIGESTLRSRNRKAGTVYVDDSQNPPLELQNIDSKRTGDPYNRVDDDTISIGRDERAAGGWQDDKESEKGIAVPSKSTGIMKTQTTVIKSEVMNKGASIRASWKPAC